MKFLPFGKIRIYNAILSLWVFVFFIGFAQGATYYVSTTGSDSNPGTQSAPFRHVSHGASAAHAGDTVIVMDGTYDNEGVVANGGNSDSVVTLTNSGSAGAPITIMAQDRGKAILDASSGQASSALPGCYGAFAYFDVEFVNYVVIQGFVIQNACVVGVRANGYSTHDITLRWNEIRNIGNWNNNVTAFRPQGIYIPSGGYNFTFDGNIFHNIGGGANVNQQHAIYTGGSNITIVNNIFYNQANGWDIQTAGGRNIYIANNTFAFPNPNRDGHIILWDGGESNSLANVVIQNNVFHKAQGYGVVSELDGGGSINGCTMQSNLTTAGVLYDNGSTYSGGGVSCSQSNNLTSTDPMVMNDSSAPYDFRLRSGSPAVDSGTNNSYTAVDNDDEARPVNRIFDRGAYEYHGSTPSAPVSVPSIALSASPSSVSVTAGGIVNVTLNATVSSSANPAFSASGLPSGVTASFSPPSCSGSCTSTLTLHVSSSAAQSSTTISVMASSSGATSGSASVALTVQAASTPTTPSSPTTPTSPSGSTATSGSGTNTISGGDYTTGLRGEWKLLTNASDSIGGNNGTLQGGGQFVASPHLFNGANDNALQLNGTNGYVSIPESSQLEMTQQLTVAFWIWTMPQTPAAQNSERIVAKVYDWDVKLNGVNPQFSSGSGYAEMNYSVPLETWTHIAFTFSNGKVQAYVNGQPVSFAGNTFKNGATLPNYPYGVYLGADSSLAYFYAGSLSDVRVYNRALSGTDVQALYAAGSRAILGN